VLPLTQSVALLHEAVVIVDERHIAGTKVLMTVLSRLGRIRRVV